MRRCDTVAVTRLAIVGAGPKGAAIAAKAAALMKVGYHVPPPQIDLFDKNKEAAAAWRGSIGYTDGIQPLCTLAERDLGFPYDYASYGPTQGREVVQAMVADFSWQSFAVDSSRYRDWVVNGRRPPLHIDFASYLQYAVNKAVKQGAASWIEATVSAIRFDHASMTWSIETRDWNGLQHFRDYDGVVITGSGPPQKPLDNAPPPGATYNLFDGKTFWLPESQRRIVALMDADPDASVLIIGAGGTAAAVAYWFARRGLTAVPITIIGREPTLFARHEGPFEDRLFTDEDAWNDLPPRLRKTFLARTTEGVVWDYVLRNLVAQNITYKCYSAVEYHIAGAPGHPDEPGELQVTVEVPTEPERETKPTRPLPRRLLDALLPGHAPAPDIGGTAPPQPIRLSATIVIDARGFDRWGFVNDFFATSPLRTVFIGEDEPATKAKRNEIVSDIEYDLSVGATLPDGREFPKGLHVPGLGSLRGPAATNLMGLGWLADRVLSTYCETGPTR